MKSRVDHLGRRLLAFFLLFCLSVPADSSGAILYKSYPVRQDRGRDILCDVYTVQANDWVLKLFKQKGEVAQENFGEFLGIFKRINPHVRDINLIRPGEQIVIPLRILKAGDMPGQESGVVTIPFVDISRPPESLSTYATPYPVRYGDAVSVLIADRFGRFGTRSYREGIRLFRLMNPSVVDLDRILAGQILYLPDPSVRKEPWYRSILENSGPVEAESYRSPKGLPAAERFGPKGSGRSPRDQAAAALDAKLRDTGVYYLPREGQADYRLDLAQIPALEFADGSMTLLPNENEMSAPDVSLLESLWARLKVVPVTPLSTAEQIVESVLNHTGRVLPGSTLTVSDSGIRVEIRAKWVTDRDLPDEEVPGRICITPIGDCALKTPDSIVRYLEEHRVLIREICRGEDPSPSDPPVSNSAPQAIRIGAMDRRSFVRDILTALNCQYSQNVGITFPYSGIQIQALTNFVSLPGGGEFLVDFGDLYGDAVAAIEKTGFRVIQIREQDKTEIIGTLLEAIGDTYLKDPVIEAADLPEPYRVDLAFSGFLVDTGEGFKVLLTRFPLHHRVSQFLTEKGIQVVIVDDYPRDDRGPGDRKG